MILILFGKLFWLHFVLKNKCQVRLRSSPFAQRTRLEKRSNNFSVFCQLLSLNVKPKFMFVKNVAKFSDMIFHSYDFQLIREHGVVCTV